MSKTWPKVRLGEVLKQIRRDIKVDAAQEYALLGARWYAKGLYIKDRKLGSDIRASNLFRVEMNDFVYNRLFAWKGSFAVATEEEHGCYVSNEFPCFQVNAARLDPYYLLRYFGLENAWNEALGLSTGATPTSRNRLKEASLLRMEIPLPPVLEQRRIVARIEQLAAKIEEARGLRREAEEAAESFIVSHHNHLAGTRKKRLGDVLSLDEDRVPVIATESYPQVGVKSFGGGLFAKAAIQGTETTYKNFNRLYNGAVVLSQVKGWEGAIAVCGTELDGWLVSPEYRTFRCVPGEVRPKYLAVLVRTEWFWGRLVAATRGVGARRERTRPEQFLSIELPMPNVQQQKMGETLFNKMDAVKSLKSYLSAELDALLPSVLDKAFKGQL